jgi:hypothetical protein
MAGTYEQASVGEPNSTAGPKWVAQFKGTNEKLDKSNLLEDTGLASPNNSAYKPLLSVQQHMREDLKAGTYIMCGIQSVNPVISGNGISGVNVPYFYFDDADYAVAGKTQQLRLRAQIAVNTTLPALTFKVGLYPITVAGGIDDLTMTLGTVVSNSVVELIEPSPSTITSKANAASFKIPSDGAYALGVVTTAALTNLSAVLLSAQLQTQSV